MPNVGITLKAPGGVKLRASTRGVKLRTPFGSQSVGTSGIRTTIGRPGIAHATVNLTRPSLTVGVGPAPATLAKNPGVSVGNRYVAVGVTAQPLAWARVGGLRLQLPGAVQRSSGKRWHEEIDEQWQAHYQRRPPAVSAQLHTLISDYEAQLMPPVRPTVTVAPVRSQTAAYIPSDQVKKHLKEVRRAAKASVSFFSRAARKSALAKADAAHACWVDDQQALLDRKRAASEERVTATVTRWKNGDPTLVYLVANALLAGRDSTGLLLSILDHRATLIVFTPDLEDAHPLGPTFGGQFGVTVEKRSKAERLAVHRKWATAATVDVTRTVENVLHGVHEVEVIAVAPSPLFSGLAEMLVVSRFVCKVSTLPTSNISAEHELERGSRSRPRSLLAERPDLFEGDQDAPAVSTELGSADDLASPQFWLELADAVEQLEGVTAKTLKYGARRTAPQSAKTAKRGAARMDQREYERSSLDQMATDLRSAIDESGVGAVRKLLQDFLEALPGLSVESADDAAEFASQIVVPAAALGLRDEYNQLLVQLPQSRTAIRVALATFENVFRRELDRADRLVEHISANPECVQSKIADALGLDKEETRWLMWNLAQFGRVLRTKKGSSYTVTLNPSPPV